MEKITHPARLKRILERMVELGDEGNFNANSLAILTTKQNEFEPLWHAGKRCLEQIHRIYETSPKISDKFRDSAQPKFAALEEIFKIGALGVNWQTFRRERITQHLFHDLDAMDAILDDKELYEALSTTTVEEIGADVSELIARVQDTDIPVGLKLTIARLLNEIASICRCYHELGEADLEAINSQLAGTMLVHYPHFKNNSGEMLADQLLSKVVRPISVAAALCGHLSTISATTTKVIEFLTKEGGDSEAA